MLGVIVLLVIASFVCIHFFKKSSRKKVEERIQSMDEALCDLRKEVISVSGSQVPGEKIIEVAGLVRGVSEAHATRKEEFALAQKKALHEMLLKAKSLGANAVIETRLNTGNYEFKGSKWQVSHVVYSGTAVKV